VSGLKDWFATLIAKSPERRTRIQIPAANVLLDNKPATVAAAEDNYIRLWLVEMFLENNEYWFKTYYPLVYSMVALRYADAVVELANVSGKNALAIEQVDLGRTIASHYPLTPLLPFRGGDMAVDCGLVSMAASNAIQSFAGVVSDFAGKLAQPQAAAAVALASSIASGVQSLLGAGDAVPQLYFHDTLGGGAPLQAGFLFLSTAPQGTYRAEDLFVTPDGLRTGTRDNLVALDAQDYLLIEIAVTDHRDDFRQFTAIRDPFEAALEAKLDGEPEKADLLRRQALRAAARSADLTATDRKVVSEAIRAGFDNDGWLARRATEGAGSSSVSPFERAIARVDRAAAKRLPDPADLPDGGGGAKDVRSVSKPATESVVAPLREVATPTSQDAVSQKTASKRRLVTGYSSTPLLPANTGPFESVIGVDERTQILDTDDAPWRMICALDITAPWGNFIGTGWFVGPRTIITAGHCVFDPNQMGGWASKIVVSPGRVGPDLEHGSFTCTRFSTTDKWRTAQDPDFDMAAIHIEAGDAWPAAKGWFGIASLPDEKLLSAMVNVSGYPGDRGNGTEQWWARNRVRAVTPRRIFYDVDTMGGQSGAPAYIVANPGAPPVVVGIHAYGIGGTPADIKMELNSAPRIIPEVADLIKGWIAADGGLP